MKIYVCLILVALLGCATSPTGRSQLVLLPDSQVDSLGVQSFQQMQSQVPRDPDPNNNRLVNCVAQLITRANEGDLGARNWEVEVFNSPQVNAFALPGAKIGVYSGLLKVARTPGQLAAVLGHEVGHVYARHGNERVSQGLVAQGGLELAGGALRNNQYRDLIMSGLGMGAQLGILLPFSRAQESEADLIGLHFMARAGFDPHEAVDLWRNMSASGGQKPPEWMSTHPADATRIASIQNKLPGELPVFRGSTFRSQASQCH